MAIAAKALALANGVMSVTIQCGTLHPANMITSMSI